MIGSLGQEIHLHSNPYANLIQRGIARCVANTLYAKYPSLWSGSVDLPRGAIPLDDNYVLLHPREDTPTAICDDEYVALKNFVSRNPGMPDPSPELTWYGRIQLPNGSRVRSAWKEDERKRGP